MGHDSLRASRCPNPTAQRSFNHSQEASHVDVCLDFSKGTGEKLYQYRDLKATTGVRMSSPGIPDKEGAQVELTQLLTNRQSNCRPGEDPLAREACKKGG